MKKIARVKINLRFQIPLTFSEEGKINENERVSITKIRSQSLTWEHMWL